MCHDKCCQECFNHHYCFLSLSIPCYILSFLSSPFPFHASSFHSFPHLVEGQRCVSPVPDTSVLHLSIPFLTFSFPCFISSFLSLLFLSMLHPTIPFLPFLSPMKHHPQSFCCCTLWFGFRPRRPPNKGRPGHRSL